MSLYDSVMVMSLKGNISVLSVLPGDTGEEIGTKGCLKMKEGQPLERNKTVK